MKNYKGASKRCWSPRDIPPIQDHKNKEAGEMAHYAITLLDEFESYTRGKLLTFVESLGGDKQTVSSRKDMIHMIMRELSEDLNGAGRFWGKKFDQAIEFGKGNKIDNGAGSPAFPFNQSQSK